MILFIVFPTDRLLLVSLYRQVSRRQAGRGRGQGSKKELTRGESLIQRHSSWSAVREALNRGQHIAVWWTRWQTTVTVTIESCTPDIVAKSERDISITNSTFQWISHARAFIQRSVLSGQHWELQIIVRYRQGTMSLGEGERKRRGKSLA